MRRREVYLVSCTAKKLPYAAPAKDLYTSPWFRRARAFVESTGCPWHILSARHGLLSPDDLTEPYDAALHTLAKADRRRWARRTAQQVRAVYPDCSPIGFVLLAGQAYRRHLAFDLQTMGFATSAPLQRLGIGRQMRWFIDHTMGGHTMGGHTMGGHTMGGHTMGGHTMV